MSDLQQAVPLSSSSAPALEYPARGEGRKDPPPSSPQSPSAPRRRNRSPSPSSSLTDPDPLRAFSTTASAAELGIGDSSEEEEETEQDETTELIREQSKPPVQGERETRNSPTLQETHDEQHQTFPKPPTKAEQQARIEITKQMDLKTLLSTFESTRVDEIHGLFRFGAYAGLTLYAVLLLTVLRYAPVESYEIPEGPERFAHVVSLLLLMVTNGSRILPLLLSENSGNLAKSGFIVGTLTVQLVAMSANLLMGFVPTPVMIDPVTGLRSHLVRWVEFTALAFLMTFFTTNIEAPLRPPGQRVVYSYSVSLAASTAAGLLFPLCRTLMVWSINMAVSCLLFLPLYVLLHDRTVRYRNHRVRHFPTRTADEQESKEILRASYVLCCTCSTTWTGLVLYYIAACVGRIVAPEHWLWSSPMLLSIGLCFFEIASKIWYLSVLIEAYDRVFDENSRVVRRFEQLRNFMAAVWDSSSDVIIFCGHCDGHINAIVSPAFFKLVGLTTGRLPFVDRGDVSLILDIVPDKEEYTVFAVDLSKPVSRQDVAKMRSSLEGSHMKLGEICRDLPLAERSVAELAQLTVKACVHLAGEDVSHMADLIKCADDGSEVMIHCEVKRTRVDDGSSVLVLRDISDRIHRFETEKKLLQETTERRKDEETTKFTRHEIKNGILAAIALLDHIKENVSRSSSVGARNDMGRGLGQTSASSSSLVSLESKLMNSISALPDIDGEFLELESTLRDVLDTILDQAMAREIVHGQYIARKERMKVLEVLASLRRRASRRFPIHVVDPPLPDLAFDRQLIRFIYRNAVSNACKYGKQDGIVETILSYSAQTRVFVMNVVNLPGEGHVELLKLNTDDVASVFSPETQLFPNRVVSGRTAQLVRNESSGNGAWIMQKCAEALGGKCSIRFEPNRTIFMFSGPVEAFPVSQPSTRWKDGEFSLPADTWGIAVDDSAIQRKLMDRFLKMAGIQDNRRRILGESSDEVFSMGDAVASLMAQHPKDKFILIVDENLDLAVDGTVHKTISGSLCVEKLRQKLDPDSECRLLALIRSANDALPDIELYKARAHGYLHKEPIQKGKVLDVIRPWWKDRFSATTQKQCDPASNVETDDVYGPSAEDILESVDMINALVAVTDESVLEKRWGIIREKLFVFKGDLKTMESTESMSSVVHRLDRLVEHPKLPENFLDHWTNIKSHIESSV